MNNWRFVLVVISIILLHTSKQGGVLGELQYSRHELPSLYTFDEYDECFQRTDATELATTYCMVYAEVKPDNSSELWQKIRTHSESNKFNYRHNRLYFGLCLNRCIEYAETSIAEDDIVSNEISEHYTKVHKRPLDVEIRRNYTGMIHNCLNAEFEKKYNLKLRTFIRYCEGRNDKEVQEELAKKDPVEVLLRRLVKLILLLVFLSTSYDFYVKLQQSEENQTSDFYKNNLEQPVPRLLTSFSLCRNYYRILQPYRSNTAKDLGFLDGLRSFNTLCVLCFHIIYSNGLHIKNPEFMEFFGNTTTGCMLLNIHIALDIFMVLSGLIVYVKFTQSRCVTPQTDIGKCIKVAILFVLQRFLRFLPSVGLLLLVNATVVSRLGDGPYWRHLSDQYRVFSRENWWKNILMINNFSLKDTMSPHTWYIATDFHLFIFYIIVLVYTAKYPQYKYRILKVLAVLAVVIPTLTSYFMKFGSSYVVQNESFRTGIPIESDEYNYQYPPFYNNLGGYLVGIFCGDFYLNHSQKPAIIKKLSYFVVPTPIVVHTAALVILWVGSVMMFKEPSIWTAIFSGLHRNLWIIFVCGLSITMMLSKFGWVVYDFFNLPLFRVLARLSFQMYIWHLLLMQLNVLYLRQPFHMNGLYYITLCLIATASTVLFAFFTTLLVEIPFAQLQDCLLKAGRRKHTDENHKLAKAQ